MGKAAPARTVALKVLGEVRRRDGRAREILRNDSLMKGLDGRDRALVMRLVLGVVASMGLIDSFIDSHLKGRAKLEPKVRDGLRLSTFELLFLSTPSAVAVSEGVELVRSVRPKAASLANAVLRKVAEVDVPLRKAALARVSDEESCEVADLALVSGYPAWLLERICAGRGKEACRDFALSATEAAPVWVAANRCLVTDEEAFAELKESGLGPVAVEGLDGVYLLTRPAGLAATGLVESCHIIVSDLAAQRVAGFVGTEPRGRVLEIGQGRATKTLLIESNAARAGQLVRLYGVETEPFKVRLAKRRVKTSGLGSHVFCFALDGRDLSKSEGLPRELAATFETVLLDAPCTGTGTLRRHPEISWRLTSEDVQSLAALQLELLRAAAARVAVGGTLIYATCSVLREEDEDVVEAFLASEEGSRFVWVDPEAPGMPAIEGPDGHFCARLIRRDA